MSHGDAARTVRVEGGASADEIAAVMLVLMASVRAGGTARASTTPRWAMREFGLASAARSCATGWPNPDRVTGLGGIRAA